jgi:ATP-binding cassette subfamily B protein
MPTEDVKAFLQQNPLFGALPEATLDRLERQLSTVSFKLGQTVLRAGEPGEAFYLIYAGKVRVSDETTEPPVTLATLGPGESFGEQSLLYRRPVSATVRASAPLVLLALSAPDFARLLQEHPELRKYLEVRARQQTEFTFLRTLNLLSSLTLQETHALIDAMETVHLPQGIFLFHEGEPGDAAYILRDGTIRIVKETADNTLLAVLRPGDMLGEIALLYDQPRSAGAVAASDAVLLRMQRSVFTQIVSQGPKARERLAKQATNRLLRADAIIASHEAPAVAQTAAQPLQLRRVTIGKGVWARAYPVVQVDTPLLAGLACVAMINRWYWRQEQTAQAIEQQLLAQEPDTLLTVSQKVEAHGYLPGLLRLRDVQLAAVPLPAIVEEANGQLAVLFSVSRHAVVVANPLTGLDKVPIERFVKTWNGHLLTVTYVPEFGAAGQDTKKLFRQFLPMARPYWQLIAGIGMVSLVLQLFGVVGPLFSQVIIDTVLVQGDYALLYLMLLGMLFVTGFQLASNTLRTFLIAHALRRINVSLLTRFFHHILSLPRKVFSKWRVGDFLLRLQENENLLQLVSQSGFKIIVDSVTVNIYLLLLLSKNAKLTGVALLFVVAYVVLLVLATPMLRANDRLVFRHQTAVESHLIEAVTGIETIKAMAAEPRFFDQGTALLGQLQLAEFRGAWLGFNIGLLSTLINQASTVTILGYGAMLTLQGELTTGELLAFTALLGLLLTPLQGLIGVWDELQEIRISFERLNDVLQLPPEPQGASAVLPTIEGHVRFENLGFCYDDSQKEVLSDIDLEVFPGQKVALVGRSGSGKTTLVNLLIVLLEPTRGKIFLDHRDISTVERPALRRQVGVVEQHPFLFNGTIRENIAKADPHASLERVVAAAMLAGAHDFIEQLPMGYDTQIGERGMTLSGGQRQRLVIARAILTNPRVLILDEATAALDTESERLIQANLDHLMAGRTTFIIAHRLSTVRNADQIVVLDQGRIVERGTHAQLMERQGLYSYLHNKTEA